MKHYMNNPNSFILNALPHSFGVTSVTKSQLIFGGKKMLNIGIGIPVIIKCLNLWNLPKLLQDVLSSEEFYFISKIFCQAASLAYFSTVSQSLGHSVCFLIPLKKEQLFCLHILFLFFLNHLHVMCVFTEFFKWHVHPCSGCRARVGSFINNSRFYTEVGLFLVPFELALWFQGIIFRYQINIGF